jgi:hypothetical protein
MPGFEPCILWSGLGLRTEPRNRQRRAWQGQCRPNPFLLPFPMPILLLWTQNSLLMHKALATVAEESTTQACLRTRNEVLYFVGCEGAALKAAALFGPKQSNTGSTSFIIALALGYYYWACLVIFVSIDGKVNLCD